MLSYPFNEVDGHPMYCSDDVRAFHKAIIPTNGVILSERYPDSMKVSIKDSGTVSVAPGVVFINGATLVPESPAEVVAIAVPPAPGVRCDYIVARFDLDAREIVLLRLAGDTQGNPPARHPANGDTIADIVLASVSVTTAGVVSVTDTRGTLQSYATVLWKDGIFPLPIPMGGTNAKTAEQARENLGLASKDHKHDIGADAVTGVLPLDRGGLGAVLSGDGVVVKSGSAFSVVPASSGTYVFGRMSNGSYGFYAPPQYVAGQFIAAWNQGVLPYTSGGTHHLSSFFSYAVTGITPGLYLASGSSFSPAIPGGSNGVLSVVRIEDGSTEYFLLEFTQVSNGAKYFNKVQRTNGVVQAPSNWMKVG